MEANRRWNSIRSPGAFDPFVKVRKFQDFWGFRTRISLRFRERGLKGGKGRLTDMTKMGSAQMWEMSDTFHTRICWTVESNMFLSRSTKVLVSFVREKFTAARVDRLDFETCEIVWILQYTLGKRILYHFHGFFFSSTTPTIGHGTFWEKSPILRHTNHTRWCSCWDAIQIKKTMNWGVP